MKVPALILVRSTSTRLPRKCFLLFGRGSVIEHVVNRASHFQFEPIVCTTEEKADDELYALMKNYGWKVFRGSTEDKIRRLRDACQTFGINEFVTIDADDPFFDPQADQESFALLKQGYDFVLAPENYYCGSVGYSVKKSILDRAVNESDTSHSEMMWKIIEKLPKIKVTSLPLPNNRMSQIRLTLDYQEDYEVLLAILERLGPFAQASDIEGLFRRDPGLFKVNWFRQGQWKQNQERVGA